MSIVTLGGVVQSYRIEQGSLNVKENTRGNPGTSTFTLLQRPGFAAPKAKQSLLITDDSAAYKLFAGYVQGFDQPRVGSDASGPVYKWDVTGTDYLIRLQRHYVAKKWVNQTLGTIVTQACADGAPEIDTSLVDTTNTPVIPVYVANYKLPSEIVKELCDWAGYNYYVDYDSKLVVVSSLGATAAIQITPSNSTGLKVTVDTSQLRNKVIVHGGTKASSPVTQTWTGDGVQANFTLQYKPYSPYPPEWVQETYDATTFDSTVWLEFDVTNPSPPAGHTGADGYIFPFPSSNLNAYTSLQVVGGPGSYGSVGLVSKLLFPRVEQRSMRQGIIFDAASDLTMGVSDGTSAALSTIKHGIRFKSDLTISRMEGGVETTSANAYVADSLTEYQIRIVLHAAGADYYIQGGTYGTFGSPTWTKLWGTTSDTTANLAVVPVLVKSGQAQIYNTIFEDQAYGVHLTVGGVDKTVGYDNVDLASGYDAVINPDTQQLRFFGASPGPSTIPALSAAISLTYTFGQPVFAVATDDTSIEKIKAAEGGSSDGIWEGFVNDTSIIDDNSAQNRAQAELRQYSNPEVTAEWQMVTTTFTLANRLRAGQGVPIQSTNAGLSGTYLLQESTLHEIRDGVYEFSNCKAGSRLRGLEDYLQSLIQSGRRFSQDSTAVLDELMSPYETLQIGDSAVIGSPDITPDDTLNLSDALVIGSGGIGPWKFGPDANPGIWDFSQFT